MCLIVFTVGLLVKANRDAKEIRELEELQEVFINRIDSLHEELYEIGNEADQTL